MFVVKKFVTFFLDPLHMGLTLSLVGLVMLWFFHGRRERQGRLLVTVGVLWICLFGMDAVAKVLMAPLENPYLPVKRVVVDASHSMPQFIVVMAAGMRPNLTANPLEDMTTVTVRIVASLTGDQEFESAETLSAFALGLVLFVVTLTLNLVSVLMIRRFREKYRVNNL